VLSICLIFQDDESEFDHFQDEEEFEGFDSERVGSSGKLDDKEAPKITITKVREKQTKEMSSMNLITGGSFSL
jgi:hypothetical protein